MAKKPEVSKINRNRALRLGLVPIEEDRSEKALDASTCLKGGDLVLSECAWPENFESEKNLIGFDGVVIQAKGLGSLLEKSNVLARIASKTPVMVLVDEYDGRHSLRLLGLGVQEILTEDGLSASRLRRQLIHSMVRFRRLQKVLKVAAGHSALQSLNRIPLGIMVVDHDCRILHSNNQAKAVLEDGSGLLQQKDGRCVTGYKDLNLELRKIVERLTSGETTDEHDQETLVVPGKNDSPSLSLLLVPAGSQSSRRNAVIFVTSPETEVSVSHATLQRLYTLTGAEAALAEKLVQGRTLEEIANETGRSAHTLRSQLKQIFQKTGTNRQSQLIKMVLTGPAVLAQPSPKSKGPAEPVEASVG